MKPMNDHAQAPAQFPMARRDYKDTLFRLLFQDRDRLLSLYNAVKGTSYASSEELTVVTLENAVYMNMKNDVAFLVDFQLNLYEHQSTWNPNMPLRNLFYAAKGVPDPYPGPIPLCAPAGKDPKDRAREE